MTPRPLPAERPLRTRLLAGAVRVVLVLWTSLFGPLIAFALLTLTSLVGGAAMGFEGLLALGSLALWLPVYRGLAWLDRRYDRTDGPSQTEWSEPFE